MFSLHDSALVCKKTLNSKYLELFFNFKKSAKKETGCRIKKFNSLISLHCLHTYRICRHAEWASFEDLFWPILQNKSFVSPTHTLDEIFWQNRHRGPFAPPLNPARVREKFNGFRLKFKLWVKSGLHFCDSKRPKINNYKYLKYKKHRIQSPVPTKLNVERIIYVAI